MARDRTGDHEVAARAPTAERGFADRSERLIVVVVALLALAAAAVIRHRVPWIPDPYLGALVAMPLLGWWIARRAGWRRRWRWPATGAVSLAFIALLPVPTMQIRPHNPPGTAWRLDGRLTIDGVTVDPGGTWYWLTVGRPPLVAEVVHQWWSTDDEGAPTSMLGGRRAHRPAVAEPAAAAVGLRRAGWPLRLDVTVEVSEPTVAGLPQRTTVATVNGRHVTTRASWDTAISALGESNTFVDEAGSSHQFAGPAMPYGRVDVIDHPHEELDVVVGGWLARTAPGSWVRQLALGPSHGLMVALVSYVYASGDDVGAGRVIAGTGKIRGDGTVGTIGGLAAKATAARQVGADVLLFPAAQRADLDTFDAGAMVLCPVATLDEAIAALSPASACGPESPCPPTC